MKTQKPMKELTKEQMEPVKGGMSCGAALGLYLVAFVCGCAVPGMGWLAAGAVVSIIGSVATAKESCKYQF